MDARIFIAIACAALWLQSSPGHAQVRAPASPPFGTRSTVTAPRTVLPEPGSPTSGSLPAFRPQATAPFLPDTDLSATDTSTNGIGRNPGVAGTMAGTNVMGASGGAAAFNRQQPDHPGPYTALDVARSFLGADTAHQGELTRAEATRLTIMPISFEEMDANHDGLLTRGEYEDALR